jgi:predicted lipoprotein
VKRAGVGLLVALTVVSCSTGPERSLVVTNIADEALIPLVEDAATHLGALEDAIGRFCAQPDDESLALAREAWADADDAWERSEVTVYYGPAPMLRTESKVDFEPVDVDGIEELLASDSVIDFDYVDNRSSANRRGLGAVEYLIFAPLETAAHERRCELASSASAVAAAAAAEVQTGWTEGDAYRSIFTGTMSSNDALSDVVGAQHEILKRMTLFELGRAMGVTAPEPDATALVEGAAGHGVDRLLSQLVGVEDTFEAGGEASLLELIRSRSTDVADEIETLLGEMTTRLESLSGPLSETVDRDPTTMNEILDDSSRLRDVIEVDVVSLLDLTLGFSDSDGDTG